MSLSLRTHATAMHRTDLSRPLRLALLAGMIPPGSSVFDYGCGHGEDVRALRARGYQADGFDLAYVGTSFPHEADVVTCLYVLNVMPNPGQRTRLLRTLWKLARQRIVLAVRTAPRPPGNWTPHGDGWISQSRTFQKFYGPHDLDDEVHHALGPVRLGYLAPGVAVVAKAAA